MITAKVLQKEKVVVIEVSGRGRLSTIKKLEAMAAGKGYDVLIRVLDHQTKARVLQ